MSKVSIVVIGAGNRGSGYAGYAKAFPDEVEVVAVCEPRKEWRERLANEHGLAKEKCFHDWKDLLKQPKLADAALICTVEDLHRDIAVALAGKKYHLLLEKPMAPTEAECREIYRAARDNGILLAVCHVLRYTDWFAQLKRMVDSGMIGRVHHIAATELVNAWHFSHSYVRGNFGNEKRSSSFLMAKCCHDIDLLNTLVPARCAKVSSFGRLSHFTRAHQPEGAADRCLDCPARIEAACPYSAVKIYLRDRLDCLHHWPVDMLTMDHTPAGVEAALREGPYGRCVYACDNDVADHQVVNLEFEDGTTAGFITTAFAVGGRDYFIMGDKGTLRFTEDAIVHTDFLGGPAGKVTRHPIVSGDSTILSGHGGGDFGLMRAFLAALHAGDDRHIQTGPAISLESHLMVFSAEESRKTGRVVDIRPV